MNDRQIRELENLIKQEMHTRSAEFLKCDNVMEWAENVWDKHRGVDKRTFMMMMAYAWEQGKRCSDFGQIMNIVSKALMSSIVGGGKG